MGPTGLVVGVDKFLVIISNAWLTAPTSLAWNIDPCDEITARRPIIDLPDDGRSLQTNPHNTVKRLDSRFDGENGESRNNTRASPKKPNLGYRPSGLYMDQ